MMGVPFNVNILERSKKCWKQCWNFEKDSKLGGV
jgi:hypothetical protein